MKSLFLALLVVLTASAVSGQTIAIEGKILDSQTEEPIPFAHIYVDGTSVGTVANADGNYIFNLPERLKGTPIVFSCLGYKSERLPIDIIKEKLNGNIQLAKSEAMLQEVIVTTEGAETIWKKAVKKHVERFTTPDHRLQAFYRTTFQEDGYFTRLLEAAMNLHGGGDPHDRSKIEFVQIRKSKDLRKNIWEVYDGYLNHLVHYHPVRRKIDLLSTWRLKRYEIEIIDYLLQDDDLYYVFKATGPEKGQHDLEMVVRERDLSIFKMTLFWHPENAGDYSWAWERREEEKFFGDWQKSIYEYQEFEGKMYLKRASWHRKGRVINKGTEETVFATESIDELLITQIDIGEYEIENKVPGEVLNIYQMADYFDYDPIFWKHYNRPADSDYFKNAKSKMEAVMPLKEQFQQMAEDRMARLKK